MKQQTYPATSQLINTKLQFRSEISAHRQIFPGWQCAKYSLFVACLLSMGVLTASCGSLPKETAEAQSQQRGGGERGGLVPVDVAIARREE